MIIGMRQLKARVQSLFTWSWNPFSYFPPPPLLPFNFVT